MQKIGIVLVVNSGSVVKFIIREMGGNRPLKLSRLSTARSAYDLSMGRIGRYQSDTAPTMEYCSIQTKRFSASIRYLLEVVWPQNSRTMCGKKGVVSNRSKRGGNEKVEC